MRNWLLSTLLILLPELVFAGSAEDAWNAYLAGDFQRVSQIVSRDGNDTNLTLSDRARLFFALGCSEAMQGRGASAADAFQHALDLDSKLNCTEEEVPPPVWQLFKPIQDRVLKAQILPERPLNPPQTPSVAIRVDTLRITTTIAHSKDSIIKSLAFPGWGHISEGNRKGYMIAVSEVLLVAGCITSAVATSNARSNYLKSRDNAAINSRYNTYNNYYRLSWGLGTAAIALYLGAQFDFFSSSPRVQLSGMNCAPGILIAWSQNL